MKVWERVVSFPDIFKKPAFKWLYFLVLFTVIAYYLWLWSDKFHSLVIKANIVMILFVFLLTGGVVLFYVFIYYSIYQGMGVKVSFPRVLKIMTLASLGKYFPGKVLFAGNYLIFSREVGINLKEIGASFVVSQSLWLLSAVVCSLPIISFLSSPLRYSIICLPFVVGLFIHPRILNWILSGVERLVGRYLKPGEVVNLQISPNVGYLLYLRIMVFYLLGWILAGWGVFFAVRAFGPIGIGVFPLCLSSAAISTVVGFLAIFAPAGLGVKEGVGTLILATLAPVEIAFFAMFLLRIATIAVWLAFALVSVIFVRSSPEEEFAH